MELLSLSLPHPLQSFLQMAPFTCRFHPPLSLPIFWLAPLQRCNSNEIKTIPPRTDPLCLSVVPPPSSTKGTKNVLSSLVNFIVSIEWKEGCANRSQVFQNLHDILLHDSFRFPYVQRRGRLRKGEVTTDKKKETLHLPWQSCYPLYPPLRIYFAHVSCSYRDTIYCGPSLDLEYNACFSQLRATFVWRFPSRSPEQIPLNINFWTKQLYKKLLPQSSIDNHTTEQMV